MGFLNGKLGLGLAIGVGASMAIPLASKLISGAAKPVLKESIKGGMVVYDRGRLMLAEARESLEDITAEAREEHKSDKGSPKQSKPKAEAKK